MVNFSRMNRNLLLMSTACVCLCATAGPPKMENDVGAAFFVEDLKALQESDPHLDKVGIHLPEPRLRIIVHTQGGGYVVDAADLNHRPVLLMRKIEHEAKTGHPDVNVSTVSMVALRVLNEPGSFGKNVQVLTENINWSGLGAQLPWPAIDWPIYRIQIWDKNSTHTVIRCPLFPPFADEVIKLPESGLPRKIFLNQDDLMLGYLCYNLINQVAEDFTFFWDDWKKALDPTGRPKEISTKNPFEPQK